MQQSKDIVHPVNIAKPMLFFTGEHSFSPPTLNNDFSAYFFAYEFQKDQSFLYSDWITVINKTLELNKLLSDYNYYPIFFTDWNIYGDGSCYLLHTKVSSAFDPEQLYNKQESEGFLETSADSMIGSTLNGYQKRTRSIIADQDVDSQMMSKWFGQVFFFEKQFSGEILKHSFQYMYGRIIKGAGASATYQACWNSRLKLQEYSQCTPYPTLNKILAEQQQNMLNFRMNQFRYNGTTKLSFTNGYLQPFKRGEPGTPLTWRKAHGSSKTAEFIGFKNVQIRDKYFLIINISTAMKDIEIPGVGPEYPGSFKLLIKDSNKQVLFTINKKFQNQGQALKFFNDKSSILTVKTNESQYSLFNQSTLHFNLTYFFEGSKTSLDLDQSEYNFEVTERFKKTEGQTIEFDIYGTRFGYPITKVEEFSIDGISGSSSSRPRNISRIINMSPNQVKEIREKVIYNGVQIFKDIQKGEDIFTVWYGNSKITQIFKKLVLKWNQAFPTGTWLVKGSSNQSIKQFQIVFENGTKKKEIPFVNGYGKFKVKLNLPLTSQNNPRHPYIQSICIAARLNRQVEKLVQKQTHKGPKVQVQKVIVTETDLTGLWFEKFIHQQQHGIQHETDWVHDVGPVLRTMALIYPKMQEIADLYNFEVKMDAMKRVFDIEDDTDVRYMPGTREMSPTLHHKIRKWLYNPIYDQTKLSRNNQVLPTIKTKEDLVHNIRNAFRLQLSTIPVYLSAMYSIPKELGAKKELTKGRDALHRIVLDEMKHLLIVSNILSALNVYVPYDPQPSNVYFIKQDGTLPQPVLQGEIFKVGPCTYDQLLQLLKIETPAEIADFDFPSHQFHCKIHDADSCQQRIQKLKAYLEKVKTQGTVTIGDFYYNITEGMWRLSKEDPNLFNGNTELQFVYPYFEQMSIVYNLRSALEQIRIIVKEGEGASIIDLHGQPNVTCHFFKLVEMYIGHNVISPVKKDPKTGHFVIQFDPRPVFYFDEKKVLSSAWDPANIEKVEGLIKKQFATQSVTVQDYPNVNSYQNFNLIFKRICVELGELYNSKEQYKEKCEKIKAADIQLFGQKLREFEKWKLDKLEVAIARMRNMGILAGYCLEPNTTPGKQNVQQFPDFNQGIAPNFSITKQFK